jgi:signal transduction histidine kinase/FixJ family two-component response regulator
MNNSPTASWITDTDGRVEYLSETYVRTFALPTENLVGKLPSELYPPEFAEQYLANIRAVAQSGCVIECEEKAPRPDGTIGEFLATLSHELRTPLNAILGWTQLLKMEGQGDEGSTGNGEAKSAYEEVAHGLEVIERNARSQTKLIEDLLDVSRITTGKLRLTVKPVGLETVVQAAVDAVRPVIEAKQINLTVRFDATRATLPGDPDRLQQVFWNLLSNAAKFTPQSGRVDVTLAQAGPSAVMLSVRDSGAGIDPKFLPFVFDRFRQADSSSTRSHGGLGIGLTIVRHIVELHGGSVAAHSDGEDRGSTFTVTLPLSGIAAGAEPPTQTQRSHGEAAPANAAASGNGAAQATQAPAAESAPAAAAEPVDLGGLRVLLVDDEPDAREVISEILRRCGAVVKTAGSAREALGVMGIEAGGVDVLVSDIAMPDEDGYYLIRELRSRAPDAGGTTPAVALTAYAREEDRQRALAAGFQSHLAKPVEPCDLAQAIASLAGLRNGQSKAAEDEQAGTDRPTMRLRRA